jgi:hypothetical protein
MFAAKLPIVNHLTARLISGSTNEITSLIFGLPQKKVSLVQAEFEPATKNKCTAYGSIEARNKICFCPTQAHCTAGGLL